MTGIENPLCANSQEVWTYCQHQTNPHGPAGGISGSDDTYAWDVNLWLGADTNADKGTSVLSVSAGKVVKYAGVVSPGASSGAVLIEHSPTGASCDVTPADCWWSGYLHMDGIGVTEGQLVNGSTVLGRIGSVSAVAEHLHFVVYEGQNLPGLLRSIDVVFATDTPALFDFTDAPLVPNISVVRVIHFVELRTRIDILRAVHGLLAYPWTDDPIIPGTMVVRVVHLTELRSALAEAYVAAGQMPPLYADSIVAGVKIKANHVTEVQAAVIALFLRPN